MIIYSSYENEKKVFPRYMGELAAEWFISKLKEDNRLSTKSDPKKLEEEILDYLELCWNGKFSLLGTTETFSRKKHNNVTIDSIMKKNKVDTDNLVVSLIVMQENITAVDRFGGPRRKIEKRGSNFYYTAINSCDASMPKRMY